MCIKNRQIHVVEWVRHDQSDIRIRGVEASGGSAPQRSTLSSWRQSRGSAPQRSTISCSLEGSRVVMDIFAKNYMERILSILVMPLYRSLQRRNHGRGVRACYGCLRNIFAQIHLVAQCRQSHWSTNEGLGCRDVCESAVLQ